MNNISYKTSDDKHTYITLFHFREHKRLIKVHIRAIYTGENKTRLI